MASSLQAILVTLPTVSQAKIRSRPMKTATQPTMSSSPVPQAGSRLASVDALRGLVMIIMALDHTRDFFHQTATVFQPDDLTRTTAMLFFTRWITHFCAPVFMFT